MTEEYKNYKINIWYSEKLDYWLAFIKREFAPDSFEFIAFEGPDKESILESIKKFIDKYR